MTEEVPFRSLIGIEPKYHEAHGFIYFDVDREQNDYDPDFDAHPDGLHWEPTTWYGGIGKQLFKILWDVCSWFDSWMLSKEK